MNEQKNTTDTPKKNSHIGIIVLVIAAIIISPFCYKQGAASKLNKLIEQKSDDIIETTQQDNTELKSEIEDLYKQKEALNLALSEKADLQTAMQNYNTDKTEFNKQISQLNSDIQNLDSSIQTKQNELNEKVAAKEEEERRQAAEAEAKRQQEAEQQRAAQQKSSSSGSQQKATKQQSSSSNNQQQVSSQGGTVWVGETGNKYHKQSCPTLKGKGHQISLQAAKDEGRTACKVCY